MRVNSMLTVGFFSIMAATAVVSASDSFAAAAQRVDIIDSLPKTVAPLDGMKASSAQSRRVDIIDSLPKTVAPLDGMKARSGGSKRVDIIDSIGSNGKVSSNSQASKP